MTTTPAARDPKGQPTGGQFAAAIHGEPSFSLPATDAPKPGLTVQELDRAESLHSTRDADGTPDYYPTMEKVFAAAREHVASTPDGRRELALRDEAERLEAITGTPARQILSFHKDLSSATSDAERLKKVRLWCDEIFNKPYGEVSFLETQMRKASQIDKPSRTDLVQQRRRLNDEFSALDVREAAERIHKQLPGATSISAWTDGGGGSDDPEVYAFVSDAAGNKLWQGRGKQPALRGNPCLRQVGPGAPQVQPAPLTAAYLQDRAPDKPHDVLRPEQDGKPDGG